MAFRARLDVQKQQLAPTGFNWYPYGTLDNFTVLNNLLHGANRHLIDLAAGAPVVDIGAADGDTAFFMETLGCNADVVDFPPTNYNGCRGVRALKAALQSNVNIHEVDLDARFELPGERYGLAFFLGILYHLKNPFGALESLARCARHALVSTRIARYNLAPDARGSNGINASRVELRSVPVAYLVDSHETNNDPTNYWMFSEAGLRRVLDRAGWDVLDFMTVGNVRASDPASNAGDERAFCLVRSRNWPTGMHDVLSVRTAGKRE
ncbi:MAG: class I SAM-dependent methyltransferase [Lysobacterales bacterium]